MPVRHAGRLGAHEDVRLRLAGNGLDERCQLVSCSLDAVECLVNNTAGVIRAREHEEHNEGDADPRQCLFGVHWAYPVSLG